MKKLKTFYVWILVPDLHYSSVVGNAVRAGRWSTNKKKALAKAEDLVKNSTVDEAFVFEVKGHVSQDVESVRGAEVKGRFTLRYRERLSLTTFIKALVSFMCEGSEIKGWDKPGPRIWFGRATVRRIRS